MILRTPSTFFVCYAGNCIMLCNARKMETSSFTDVTAVICSLLKIICNSGYLQSFVNNMFVHNNYVSCLFHCLDIRKGM